MDYASSAVWSTSYKNNLPDSAFLYIESGGKKDADGKTTPRSLRHFPYKDSSGKIDIIHLRNAIARIPIAAIPKGLKKPLQDKARRLLKDSKKKSKSNLFVATLNKICAQNILTANVKTDYKGPCCEAFDFYSRQDVTVKKISDLYVLYAEELIRSPNGSTEFEKYYIFNVNDGILRFLDNYCSCKKYAGGFEDMQITYIDVDPAELNPPISIDPNLESSCENRLTALIDSSGNPYNMIHTINQYLDDSMSYLGHRAVRKYLDNFAKGLNFLLDHIKTSPVASHLVNTDNFKDFINDMCRLRASDRSLYGRVINTAFQESLNPFLRESAREEMEFIRTNAFEISAPEAPERICAPVLDEETQSSLPAFGISETVIISCLVGAGLYMGRGPIKSVCRRLLGLNKPATTAAVAACVAASAEGTGTATVNPNDPALKALIGDVLDKTCSESGQVELFRCDDAMEGGEDAGGEVDAPGGGDVGAGGDLL